MKLAAREVRFDAVAMLEADHRRMRRLFGEHEKAGREEQPDIAERIFTEVEIHIMLEERILYPALEPFSRRDGHRLDQALIGNAAMRSLISELRRLDPRSHRYETRLRSLRADLEHQIRQEEKDILPHRGAILTAAGE